VEKVLSTARGVAETAVNSVKTLKERFNVEKEEEGAQAITLNSTEVMADGFTHLLDAVRPGFDSQDVLH
jgi:hypothetical protein